MCVEYLYNRKALILLNDILKRNMDIEYEFPDDMTDVFAIIDEFKLYYLFENYLDNCDNTERVCKYIHDFGSVEMLEFITKNYFDILSTEMILNMCFDSNKASFPCLLYMMNNHLINISDILEFLFEKGFDECIYDFVCKYMNSRELELNFNRILYLYGKHIKTNSYFTEMLLNYLNINYNTKIEPYQNKTQMYILDDNTRNILISSG